MNSQKIGLRVASLLFALFALGHLLRLLNQAQVIVGSQTIPLWISAPLAVLAALLSFWMWKLSILRLGAAEPYPKTRADI